MKTLCSKKINPEKFKGDGYESMYETVQFAERTASYLNKENKEKVKNCLVCDQNHHNDVLTAFGIEFVQCQSCTHVFQKYQISDEAVYRFFESDTEINCHLVEDHFQYRCENINKPKIEEIMMSFKKLLITKVIMI